MGVGLDSDEWREFDVGASIHWPVLAFALMVALVSAVVIVIFTVVEVPDSTALAVALGTFPVLVFFLTALGVRWLGLAVLSIVLAAYTWLWVAVTFSYDESSTGGIAFFFVPFYGVTAMMLVRFVIWIVRAIRHPTTASKTTPDPDGGSRPSVG